MSKFGISRVAVKGCRMSLTSESRPKVPGSNPGGVIFSFYGFGARGRRFAALRRGFGALRHGFGALRHGFGALRHGFGALTH